MERTRWWPIIVSIAVLNVVWSLVGVLSGDTISVGPATVWILFGGSFLLLTPVFYYSLYQETSAIRDNETPWNPDQRVWVGGGIVLSLIGSVLFLNPLTHYITGLYLLQRLRNPTVPYSEAKID